ncbi:MAG: DNA alkylation repair protein [Chloroflexaceae bacterium]|nr:DNA alkylation repair protein [Chloroflexaceae bacterium]
MLRRYLARGEQQAHHERNFVKKAVNWAIRKIGRRSAALNAAAIAVAKRLPTSDSRTACWVGSGTVRELTSAKIAQY